MLREFLVLAFPTSLINRPTCMIIISTHIIRINTVNLLIDEAYDELLLFLGQELCFDQVHLVVGGLVSVVSSEVEINIHLAEKELFKNIKVNKKDHILQNKLEFKF